MIVNSVEGRPQSARKSLPVMVSLKPEPATTQDPLDAAATGPLPVALDDPDAIEVVVVVLLLHLGRGDQHPPPVVVGRGAFEAVALGREVRLVAGHGPPAVAGGELGEDRVPAVGQHLLRRRPHGLVRRRGLDRGPAVDLAEGGVADVVGDVERVVPPPVGVRARGDRLGPQCLLGPSGLHLHGRHAAGVLVERHDVDGHPVPEVVDRGPQRAAVVDVTVGRGEREALRPRRELHVARVGVPHRPGAVEGRDLAVAGVVLTDPPAARGDVDRVGLPGADLPDLQPVDVVHHHVAVVVVADQHLDRSADLGPARARVVEPEDRAVAHTLAGRRVGAVLGQTATVAAPVALDRDHRVVRYVEARIGRRRRGGQGRDGGGGSGQCSESNPPRHAGHPHTWCKRRAASAMEPLIDG